MNSKIENGTDANFEQLVTQSDMPVLVDFSAPWCGPCKQMEPILEELATEYSGRARIVKVDVDQNQEKAGELGIRSIPAVILFHQGNASDTLIGVRTKSDYVTLLDGAL